MNLKVINSVISAIIYEQSPGISFEKILQSSKKNDLKIEKGRSLHQMTDIRKK